MSSDDKEAKTYNGDKKEDWKAFYDEAVRICRQELGSAGVEWFNGEVEKITGQNLQRVIHDEYYLICTRCYAGAVGWPPRGPRWCRGPGGGQRICGGRQLDAVPSRANPQFSLRSCETELRQT